MTVVLEVLSADFLTYLLTYFFWT